MKILVFGRGVISSQYAWAFEKAGNEVEFYVRHGSSAKYGVSIDIELWDARNSSKGILIKEKWPVVFHEEINVSHDYDLIFVSINSHQISEAVSYLTPRIGNATVLFFNNFWEDPIEAVSPLPPEQIVWGFPGGGGGFHGNTLHGGFAKTVMFGKFRQNLNKRDIMVRNLFMDAGFKVNEIKNFRSWLWGHFAFNAAMEIELLKVGSFAKLFDSQKLLANLGLNLKELLPLIKAKGEKIDLLSNILAHIPAPLIGLIFAKVVFKENSVSRRIMEYNNSKIGHSLSYVLNEAEKLSVSIPRAVAAKQYLPKDFVL